MDTAKKIDFCSKAKKYIEEKRGNIVGRTVWFCVNKNQRLKCVINDDGTVSIADYLEKRFKSASELISALNDGSITVGNFKLPRKEWLKSPNFSKCLFFSPDSTKVVSSYIDNPDRPFPLPSELESTESNGPSTSEKSTNKCPGFVGADQTVYKIGCGSLKINGEVIHGRKCVGFKKLGAEMCPSCIQARSLAKRAVKAAMAKGEVRMALGIKKFKMASTKK